MVTEVRLTGAVKFCIYFLDDFLVSKASKQVSTSSTIEVGEVANSQCSQWVKVLGKGNFLSSPSLKSYVDKCLEATSCHSVVVDLLDCPAMDSTFMGTLAGLAGRLLKRGGELSIVGLSERNRASLEDLGISELMSLEGEDGKSEWQDGIDEIRSGLTPWGENQNAAAASEVLEAHRQLCEVNPANYKKFETVLNVLEKEQS